MNHECKFRDKEARRRYFIRNLRNKICTKQWYGKKDFGMKNGEVPMLFCYLFIFIPKLLGGSHMGYWRFSDPMSWLNIWWKRSVKLERDIQRERGGRERRGKKTSNIYIYMYVVYKQCVFIYIYILWWKTNRYRILSHSLHMKISCINLWNTNITNANSLWLHHYLASKQTAPLM